MLQSNMAFVVSPLVHASPSAHVQKCSARRYRPSATATHPAAANPASISSETSVSLVSLGCPKNVTDAEVMLSDLAKNGIKIQSSEAEAPADVIVVNTCGFVEDAKRESIDAILNAAKGKENGTKGVIITGCLAQRYADLLAEELPEIDAVVGFEHYHELPQRVKALAANEAQAPLEKVKVGITDVPFRPEHERVRLGPKHSVYVRLAEGCSHSCTFCAIPGQFRGKFRSKAWDSLTKEIETLVAAGAKELVFIAEDTNQYGMDFPPEESRRLSHLLHHVARKNTGAKWLRLLYCYPSYFTDELVRAIAELDIVCKYIDIPLQHISDNVLRRMNRPGRKHTEELLKRLREGIPDLALRTTFIVGFPGETEEDHLELLDFIKKSRFQHAGFFIYSEEEGTPAAQFEDQVPEELREYRRDELVSMQQQIQEEIASERVGQILDVIVDKIEDGHSIGRCRFDAPDIDGCVHILQRIEPGTILKVRILGTSSFDLYGEPAE
ncbi:Methylthiotransferase [Gracilaria domingensis]|nr:Methylthiotransferase [Gracilaria domingensis]